MFLCHLSHSFTQPPPPHPNLSSLPHPTPIFLPPSSLLSNYVHTTQGAHGLDGRPGPVVSGASPAPVPSPFSSSSSSSSTPLLQLANCLPCLLVMSTCFPAPMPVLSLFLPEAALWGQTCSGLGSEDVMALRIYFDTWQTQYMYHSYAPIVYD